VQQEEKEPEQLHFEDCPQCFSIRGSRQKLSVLIDKTGYNRSQVLDIIIKSVDTEIKHK
jgi:hypothetical protein